MRAAISQARIALSLQEVPVGAVVVCGQRVVGRGHNLVETLCDSTAHAEMQALTAAMNTMGSKYLPDCTLYVTLEPCIMCAGALAWSQIGEVVYGLDDPKRGCSTVPKRIYHPKTAVRSGLLEGEIAELMSDFFKKIRK